MGLSLSSKEDLAALKPKVLAKKAILWYLRLPERALRAIGAALVGGNRGVGGRQ